MRGMSFAEHRPAAAGPISMRVSPRQMVPCNMTLDRAWRWCILATVREVQAMRRGGRDIAWPNLRRLFMRRWADTCLLYDLPEDGHDRSALQDAGIAVLGDAFARLRRARLAA